MLLMVDRENDLLNGRRQRRDTPNGFPRNTGNSGAFRTFGALRISWKSEIDGRIHAPWRYRAFRTVRVSWGSFTCNADGSESTSTGAVARYVWRFISEYCTFPIANTPERHVGNGPVHMGIRKNPFKCMYQAPKHT